MKSRIYQIIIFFVSFILLVDGLSFVGLSWDFPVFGNPVGIALFWIVSAVFILVMYIYGRIFLADNKPGFFARFYVFSGIFLAVYVPKIFYITFFLIEIVLKLLAWPLLFVFAEPAGFMEFFSAGPLNFISMIVLPLSLTAFVVVIWGIIFGRFNYKVRTIEVASPDIPEEFDELRIIQISDMHLGSLHGHQDKIRKAVELINQQEPDLILFTGDLVNNLAEEAKGWTGILSGMKSSLGNYSILGNHDYGEYYNWPDEESRLANIDRLIQAHQDSGFNILLNRSEKIQKGEQRIYISGVENWGLPPFKQYGDLEKAMQDVPEDAFTVLLSHDPSHWDAEVLRQSRVQLTLSGHTHGMQFGIRTKKFKWSPVQFKYPRWIGLYQQGNQFLHVNPGLGYIGYAGRIGIPPEITLIKLRKIT